MPLLVLETQSEATYAPHGTLGDRTAPSRPTGARAGIAGYVDAQENDVIAKCAVAHARTGGARALDAQLRR